MRLLPLFLSTILLLGAGCSDTSELGDLMEDGADPSVAIPTPLPPISAGVASNQGVYGTWRLESYTRNIGSSQSTMAHYGRTMSITPSAATANAVNFSVANWVEDYGTEVVQTNGSTCTFSGTRDGLVDLLPASPDSNIPVTLRFHLTNASGSPKGVCEYAGGNPNGAAGQVEGTIASPSVNPNGLIQDYSFVLSEDTSTLTLSGTIAPTPLSATMVWKRVQ